VKLAVVAAIVVATGVVWADPETDAERDFQAAVARGDAAALEALGARRPTTRWTDDAWNEAARLAERAGDYARARRDLEQVVTIGTDEQLVRRARAELARLQSFTGDAGQWNGVAAEHERLAARIVGGGDPKPALDALAALVAANPAYPRGSAARIVIAQGWERDGDADRALTWLREAVAVATRPLDQTRARIELVRMLIRHGELAQADGEIDRVAADSKITGELRGELRSAERHATIRIALWIALALIAMATAFVLRRDAGSWRAAGKSLARPPIEVLFLLPIAVVLAVVAATGNPMVARAVRAVAIVGVGVAWLSGAMLELARRRRGKLGARRAAVHAAVAAIAVVAASYLAIDRDRMIDLIVETWRSGPAPR